MERNSVADIMENGGIEAVVYSAELSSIRDVGYKSISGWGDEMMTMEKMDRRKLQKENLHSSSMV